MKLVLVIAATFALPIEVPTKAQVAEIERAYQSGWAGLVAQTLEPWSEPLLDLREHDIALDMSALSDWGTSVALLGGSNAHAR